MPSPEKIVLLAGGTLMLAAVLLFNVGTFCHLPALRTTALWVWGAAGFVAVLPLLVLVCVLCERSTRAKPPVSPDRPGAYSDFQND